MALAGELAKYIGNEIVKVGGKDLATKTATSALSSLVPKAVTKATTNLATGATLGSIIPKMSSNAVDESMMKLYRGLTQKYDPNYPVAKLDTSGYESWTDNPDLARKYGDNVYSIEVPKSDIKTSYLDEDPMSPTYGDRNPIYSIDKKAGLDGVSGNEYLLEVGTDYQKGLKYTPVDDTSELNMAMEKAGVGSDTVSRAQHFIPKRNIPVETAGDFPNSISRVPVKVGGREMDTSRLYTGEIPELYHQTTASSLGDMTLDRRRAVSGDSGMPEGIFLKDHDEDIGLMGKNQLALNAKMERPAYFKDRADLDNFIRSRGGKDLMSRRDELDDYYQKLSDEAEKKQHDLAVIAWNNPTPENKALAQKAMEDWQKVTEEWTKAIDNNGEVAREGIRNTLVNNGYDSAIIENDAGSGGRSVKSYIAFDKNQLSPRYSKDINFDPNDAQSVFNEAKRRQKDLDTVMKNIADKITAEGDKAVYKSGGNKSINSMVNKVDRKKTAGRDYRLLDMKDHMRGAVMLENLNNDVDEITSLLENMQYIYEISKNFNVNFKILDTNNKYSLYLKEGEAFTVKELLDALLIHSCNDVAVVLARYVGGTEENFVKMMNDEAKAIGAKNTHFNNPHGLDEETKNYSTAYDMALLAKYAYKNNLALEVESHNLRIR